MTGIIRFSYTLPGWYCVRYTSPKHSQTHFPSSTLQAIDNLHLQHSKWGTPKGYQGTIFGFIFHFLAELSTTHTSLFDHPPASSFVVAMSSDGIIYHYFNFYYITCRAVKAFLFNWVERFRRQTCHSHHTWSNENVTRLYYSHVAADASGEWIHVEFVSLDSSRLQTRQWRKQWVTRRGFYLLWRFLALSETKWWYSSSTSVFLFSWRVKSHH